MDLMLKKEQLHISPKFSSHPIFLTVYFKGHQFSHLDFLLPLYFPRSVPGRTIVMPSVSYLERSVLLAANNHLGGLKSNT